MKNWEEKVKNKIKDANYYVYEHYLDNKLFYIGKGSGKRCFHYRDRSKRWNKVVGGREKEIIVKIKMTFSSENGALRYERYRIEAMSKKYNLANVDYNTKLKDYIYPLSNLKVKNKTSYNNNSYKKKENVIKNDGSHLHKNKMAIKIEHLENSLINLINLNNSKQSELSDETLNIAIEAIREKVKNIREVDHTNELSLSEVIKKENVKFSSNNLILSPFGSGRKSLIKDFIKTSDNKVLLLVPKITFKEYLSSHYKCLKKVDENRYIFKSNDISDNDNEYIIHIMSYHNFGEKIRLSDYYARDFTHIFCKSIGSIFNSQKYVDNTNLAIVIKFLFNKQDNKEIYYFDEAEETLSNIRAASPDLLKQVEVVNFLNYPQIRRFTALLEYKINGIDQIRPHLKSKFKIFNHFGYKALAFNKTIAGQKRIARIAEEEGYKPLVLWSVNNEDEPMTEEQLKARKELIETGCIPKPYNFLIINNAMQEGWDLIDDKVKLAIINTINETEKIQSVGRLRRDLDILVYRVGKSEKPDIYLNIDKKYINVWLTNDEKKKICKELNVKDNSGRIMMWTSIKRILENQGYIVADAQKVIDGKRLRASKIAIVA